MKTFTHADNAFLALEQRTETYLAPSQSVQDSTIGGADRSSKFRIVSPKILAILDNMRRASRIQDGVETGSEGCKGEQVGGLQESQIWREGLRHETSIQVKKAGFRNVV